MDPVVRQEFESSATPEEANVFWHKYISREKNEKHLIEKLAKTGYFGLGDYKEAATSLKKGLSIAAHSSASQNYFDTLDDWRGMENGLCRQIVRISPFLWHCW